MELLNEMSKAKQQGAWGTKAWDEGVEIYIKMLAPICPHISEEVWAQLGKPYSIHQQLWSSVDESAAAEDEIELPIQVNGKLRDRITVPIDIGEEDAKKQALSRPIVQQYLGGRPPKKIIYVAGRLINIVG
jgi:leucyl-tRNA synthetase